MAHVFHSPDLALVDEFGHLKHGSDLVCVEEGRQLNEKEITIMLPGRNRVEGDGKKKSNKKKKKHKNKKKGDATGKQTSSLQGSDQGDTSLDTRATSASTLSPRIHASEEPWMKDQNEQWKDSFQDSQSIGQWPEATSIALAILEASSHTEHESLADESIDPRKVFHKIDKTDNRRGVASKHISPSYKETHSTGVHGDTPNKKIPSNEASGLYGEKWEMFGESLSSSQEDGLNLKPVGKTGQNSQKDDGKSGACYFREEAALAPNPLFESLWETNYDQQVESTPARSSNNNTETKSAPTMESLVAYLLSMGVRQDNAESVVASFVASRQDLVRSVVPNADSDAISRKAQAMQPPTRSPRPRQYPATSLRPVSSTIQPPPQSIPEQSGAEVPPPRSEQTPMGYPRFEQPGTVEVERRTFGVPIQPLCEQPKALENSTIVAVQAMVAIDNVNDDDDLFVAVAKPLSLKSALQEKSFRRMICVIVSGLLVLAAIVAGIISTQVAKGGASSANQETTTAPSSAPTMIDDAILAKATELSGWDVFNNPFSPQMKAVGWLSTLDQVDHDNFGPSFEQRYALVVMFFSTGGPQWISREKWLDPTLHECDWSQGLVCSVDITRRRAVVVLDITRNGLMGKLPSELFLLTSCEYLRMPKNQLGGSLPSEIGKFTRMVELDLSSNGITGTIPPAIGNATYLETIDLSRNVMTGSFPKAFFKLSMLKTLQLEQNLLTGTILDDIRNLTFLEKLNLRNNKMSGTITSGLIEISSLDFVWLDYNDFTGGLPTISGKNGNRLEITLRHNKLTGRPPLDAGLQAGNLNPNAVFRIQKVDLSYNQLSGTISPLAAYVPSLQYLDLSGNNFYGPFPGDSGWAGLQYLGVADCNFNGTIPTGFPTSLKYLDFSNNSMVGGIPEGICKYTELEFLKIGHNIGLVGSIPSCIGNASQLQSMDVSRSSLTGKLPTEIGLLSAMQTFNVSGNALAGTIPLEIGEWTKLKALDLSHNQLTGTIPTELATFRFAKVLDVSNNFLTGQVPAEIGSLSELESLVLSGNDLEGSVPSALCMRGLTFKTSSIGCTLECSCCNDTDSCG